MAYEVPNFYVGQLPADIDMSLEASFQFAGVSVRAAVNGVGTGNGLAALVPPVSTSNPMIGILQNNPVQGEAGTVMVEGVSKAICGGTVAIGDPLMVNGAGAFLKATTGNLQVAIALENAVAGDVFTVLLQRNGKA